MADKVAPYGLKSLVTGNTGQTSGGSFFDSLPDAAPAQGAQRGGGYFDSLPDAKPAPKMNAIAAGQQGILQGMTFGFGDELMAGAMTPVEMAIRAISGEDSGKGIGERVSNAYDISLANQRAQLHAAEDQHPIAMGAGKLAGGAATGGALAKGGVTLMRAPMNLPTMVAAGAGEGAAYGAVGGFGEGEGGIDNRVGNALNGAAWGAAIGGAVPLVARAVGASVSAIRDKRAASPAQRLILDDIANEGMTPQELAARAKSLGSEGMLADSSETLRLRAEQLAQSDNPARPGVIDALKTRSAGAEARTNALYDDAAGARPNVKQTIDNIIAARSAEAQPLYETSLSKPVVWDNRLQQFIDEPILKKGIAQGVKIQRLESLAEGKPFNPHDYAIVDFDAAGDPILGQVPNMRTLNVAKKGLDALVEASKNEYGRLTEEGRAIDKVRRAFLSKLDAANPEYAAARKAWQGQTEVLQAFEKGRDIFKSSTHPDFLASDIADMSAAAKDALELGIRSAADDAMGQVRNGALKGRTLLDASHNERKLVAALGEDKARPLINGLLGEQEMATTANQALGNSATARRMDNPFRPQTKTGDDRVGIIQNALNLKFGDAGKRALQYAQDAFAARKAQGLAREAGPMLTAKGADLDRVTSALIEAQARRAGVDATNPEIERVARELLMGGARAYRPLSLLAGGQPG